MSTDKDLAGVIADELESQGHGPRHGNLDYQYIDGPIDLIKVAAAVRAKLTVDQDTSDGYHTFAELYRYRMLFNALLFNEWAKRGMYDVHKSYRHDDDTLPFPEDDNWFIVVAELPTGQISNHYQLKDWEKFRVPIRDRANRYDGHTPEQAAERMAVLIELTRVED